MLLETIRMHLVLANCFIVVTPRLPVSNDETNLVLIINETRSKRD